MLPEPLIALGTLEPYAAVVLLDAYLPLEWRSGLSVTQVRLTVLALQRAGVVVPVDAVAFPHLVGTVPLMV